MLNKDYMMKTMKTLSNKMILVAISISAAMVFTDTTILGVALPAIQKTFDATRAQSQWVVTIYILFLSILVIAAGQISDIFGSHKTFSLGTTIFVLGSLFSGLSISIHMLIAARALQAIGFGFLMNGSMGLIAAFFDENSRGRAIGIMMGVGTFMMVVAPFVGGVFIKYVNWHWIFFINCIVGVLISPILLSIYQSNVVCHSRHPFDWYGFIFIGATIGVTVYVSNHLLFWGWLSWHSIAGMLLSIFLMAIFYFYEKRTKHPLVDFSLFQLPNYLPGSIIVGLVQTANFFPILFGVYIQNALGFSPLITGILLLPSGLMLTIFEYIGGVAADKHGARKPVLFGLAILFLGFFSAALTLKTLSYYFLLPALLGYGIGISFIGAPIRTSIMNKTPKEKIGRANAIISGTRQIGGVLIFSIISSLIVFVEQKRALHQLKSVIPNLTPRQSHQLLGLLSHTDSSHLALIQFSHTLQEAIRHIVLNSYVSGFFAALLLMSILFLISFCIAWQFLKA